MSSEQEYSSETTNLEVDDNGTALNELSPLQKEVLEKVVKYAPEIQHFIEKGAANDVLMAKMIIDEEVKTGMLAFLRTCINLGITAADLIPVMGDAISLIADASKLTSFDVTPDVSKKLAWGSEILEFFSLGVLPTHAIETVIQAYYDIPKIRIGLTRMKEIWSAHKDVVESTEISEAALIFLDE